MKIRERMEFHKYSQEALRITAGAVVTKDVPANAIDGGGLYLVTALAPIWTPSQIMCDG